MLDRRFTGWAPNRAWVGDFTYVRTAEGWLYLACILDLASHRKLLRDYKMIPSMSSKANCWDNAAMESFFKMLKVERIYQLHYDTRAQARLDIVDWIEGFYNRDRMHSAINYQTPVAAEASLIAAQRGVRQNEAGPQ